MRGTKAKLITAVLLVSAVSVTGCVACNMPASIQVEVDASKVIGVFDSASWANVGYGPLYGDTVNEGVQPFWELVRETGAIRYVRCFGIFSDGIYRGSSGPRRSSQYNVQNLLAADDSFTELAGTDSTSAPYFGCRIYSEDVNGKPTLDFWHLDHVFDVFLSAGVKPIVVCCYMPDALAEGDPIRKSTGGLINTPKDYIKWQGLIYETVKHCVERYGAEEVRSWYWEIWNEPDLTNSFIDGVPSEVTVSEKHLERFLKMYDYFAEGAKTAEPGVRIGGPAIARRDGEWLGLFLEHCVMGTNYANGNKGTALDFISWHAYGSLDYIEETNLNRQDTIELFPELKDCELLLDEWGQEFSPANPPTTNTNYEAAFLCKFLDTIINESSRQPDLFLRWGKLAHYNFATGWRPLCIWSPEYIVPLPVMNAYIMLAKMGNDRLELTGGSYEDGVHGFASRTDNGVQILLYRFIEQETIDTNSPVEVDLTITGLPDSSFLLKHYRIDSCHSNAMAIWEDMGQPDTPSEIQLKELESKAQLQLLSPPSRVETKNGRATIKLSLPVNAVSLIVVGGESGPRFTRGEHITRVLQHEIMYQIAQQKLANGDIPGAKLVLERLIEDCVPDESSMSASNPHCFWGQKALFSLVKLEEMSGNNIAADLARQRLLKTTLNDTDRFILLKARLEYLENIGNTDEINSLQKELQTVRTRLQTFAWWSVWSDAPR